MLTIRKEHLERFAHAAVRNFEDRMVAHLRAFAPRHFKILTEEEIRGVIRHGMAQAQRHGFTSERNIRLYVELMLVLGSGFDVDPQWPWAAELLNADALTDEVERMDRLQDRAWQCLEQLVGDYRDAQGAVDPQRFVEQIRRLRHEREEVLTLAALPAFVERVMTRLQHTFPRKCAYLGDPGLRQLIDRSRQRAAGHGVTSERGVAFFVACTFTLGGGFDEDPQLPWGAAILNDPAIPDQRERVDKLLAAAVDCLQRWWA